MEKKEIEFDESYIKLTNFIKERPTREKLEEFMKENPSLIIQISKDQLQKSKKKQEVFMKKHPIGAEILKEDEEIIAILDKRKEKVKKLNEP
ncbi:MAG: hypothetical protein ACFE8C_11055 [Promethearchaeota archaeon]